MTTYTPHCHLIGRFPPPIAVKSRIPYLEATAALVATGARARDREQATIVNM
jgi:hypothetical protein